MTTFYIFRHGETFATKANSGYGVKIFSAPLLDEGKPAIERMGNYLKNIQTDFNATSQFLRCRQTAEIISKASGKQFVIDKRIGEFFLKPFGHFRRRLKSFLKTIEQKNYQSVAICSHQAVIVMLLELLRGTDYRRLNSYNYPTPGILLIVDQSSVKEINFTQSN